MANTVGGFYQTLVTAATQASAALMGTNSLLDCVYKDYKPAVADIGQVINVVIPATVTGSVSDAGLGDITPTDVSETTVPITFNKHPYYSFVVRDFEQYNTPRDIRTTFLDAAIKGILENIDQAVSALLQPANFTTNTAIATTGSLVTVDQFLTGYANLANQKADVTDAANMSLVANPAVYAKILGNSSWTQALIAGEQLATDAHIRGKIVTSYGASINMDQALNSLTTGTAPNLSYTAAYFHRYAIALATRPLATPDTGVVDVTVVDYKGVPVRIMMGYNHLKLGWVVSVDAGYGLAVTRQNLGQLFTVAQ